MSLPPEFLALFGVFVLAAIAPGADFACVLRESVSFGRRAGIASAIGVGSAIMVHVAYTVTGVGLIVAQSVLIFTIVKWCGAAYLVYLGVRSLTARRSSPQGLDRTAATPFGGSRSVVTSYGVGFLTNLLNLDLGYASTCFRGGRPACPWVAIGRAPSSECACRMSGSWKAREAAKSRARRSEEENVK